jgi:hypothetical protein
MNKIIVEKSNVSSRMTVFRLGTEVLTVIDNEEIPVWCVSQTYSRFTTNFKELFQYAVSHQEEKKLYQFFIVSNDLDTKLDFISEKYNCYLEHQVKKNSLTGYENIDHDVLEYTTTSNDRFIHLWVQKNEYRTI